MACPPETCRAPTHPTRAAHPTGATVIPPRSATTREVRATRILALVLSTAVSTALILGGVLLLAKPLRVPLVPLWSARRGEYRILYRIEDHRLVVQVVTIEHRRDVYHRS